MSLEAIAAQRTTVLAFFILLLGLFHPVEANSVYANATGISNVTRYSNATEACQQGHIIGNTDLYGTGVRTSLYLQWASITTAYLVAPSQSTPAFIAALVISLSIWISVVSNFSRDGSLSLDFAIVEFKNVYFVFGNNTCS